MNLAENFLEIGFCRFPLHVLILDHVLERQDTASYINGKPKVVKNLFFFVVFFSLFFLSLKHKTSTKNLQDGNVSQEKEKWNFVGHCWLVLLKEKNKGKKPPTNAMFSPLKEKTQTSKTPTFTMLKQVGYWQTLK